MKMQPNKDKKLFQKLTGISTVQPRLWVPLPNYFANLIYATSISCFPLQRFEAQMGNIFSKHFFCFGFWILEI